MSTFGSRLKDIMQYRKTIKAELARACGMPHSQISKYCKDEIETPTSKTLIKICKSLDCSPDWLLKGEGSKDDKFNYKDFSPITNMENRVSLLREGSEYCLRIKVNPSEIRDMFGEIVAVI